MLAVLKLGSTTNRLDITVTSSTALSDLRTVTAARLRVRDDAGVVAYWTLTIVSAARATMLLRYEPTDAELGPVGKRRVVVELSTGVETYLMNRGAILMVVDQFY